MVTTPDTISASSEQIIHWVHSRPVAVPRPGYGARPDGSLRNLLARLARIDVLVIDDWAMAPLLEPERRDFWEICEDRRHE